ncbi:hexosaminidase [Mucilaginibacter yixingensis]|uniref:beta-N-acetylhexosaminidase n=1 Tax=Mucilaginibacter yixingensis TaxID=1295612 RepID=A0A2T5JA10_9SPHI|nr:family 20 glycosylhydrolase [Mucilaginibacter yixingensis]PTQ96902.1 hexosaminidase [Mucilaginibacter yixingensis]
MIGSCNRFIFLIVLCVWFSSVAKGQDNPNLNIIPAPISVQKQMGQFNLSNQTVIIADSINNKSVQFFSAYLHDKFGLQNQLKAASGPVSSNSIVLTSEGSDGLPAEGYRLTITPQQIKISGKGAGLFYGVQSLIQLLPLDKADAAVIPCATIEDYPRFGYRGMHLDVARHFFSVDFVKKYIDLLATYKLNNFHWHLTDDQGWRIEIKKYPRLTTVGSQRAQTLVGRYRSYNQQYDNTPYGGFYTQDEIRDVVKYAADRYINIIPEIEMPGHSRAALAAYPEFSCNPNRSYKVAETWSVEDGVYCPSEKTFAFLQDVLAEVMDLFPSKYIHIGGDEVAKSVWHNSLYCRQMIKRLRLKNEHGLQSYFIHRIEKFVNSQGRSIIGWDEILQGGLAPNATVMSWRSEWGGIAAAQQKHNVIMSPSNEGLYFDFAQGRVSAEPLSIGRNSTYQKVYNYNPMPAALNTEQQQYVIGVQANMWTEYIDSEEKLEYMLLPRLMALSEIAWTPQDKKNLNDFAETRMPHHLAWLDKSNCNFRVDRALGVTDTMSIGSQLNVALKPTVEGAKIYYTTDGFAPDKNSKIYNGPLNIDIPDGQYRELQTMVITPGGRQSQVTHTVMANLPPLPAINFQANDTGVKYKLMLNADTAAKAQEDTVALIPDSGMLKSFNTSLIRKTKNAFGVIFSGFIRIDTDGIYSFSTKGGDGTNIMIDDQPVVATDKKQSTYLPGGGLVLKKGYHRFTLKYFDTGNAGDILHVYMEMPGKPKGELSAETIFN